MKRTCLYTISNTDEQNSSEFHLVEQLFKKRILDPKGNQSIKSFVRMKRTNLFLFAIIFVSFFSCQNHDEDDFSPSNLSLIESYTDDGKWNGSYYFDRSIDRLTYIEIKLPYAVLDDNISKTQIKYSGNKITSIANFIPGNPIMSSLDGIDHEIVDTFYYSTSNLPDSSITYKTYAIPIETLTISKNKYSRLNDTTIIEEIKSEYIDLNYYPGKRYPMGSFKNEIFFSQAQIVPSLIYSNALQNVSHEKKWVLNIEKNEYSLSSEIFYTYDNHPNPFSYNPVRRSKNNVVKAEYINYNQGTSVINSTWTYHFDISYSESGYPSKIVQFYNDVIIDSKTFKYNSDHE